MALGKISHLHFLVEDLEETYKYFTEKLGFEFVRRGHGGRSIDLVSSEGGPTFEFNQITEEYKTAKPEDNPDVAHIAAKRRPYLDHIAFEVENVEEKVKELKSEGVEFLSGPTLNPLNKRILADLYDLEGHAWIQLQGKGSEKQQE